MTRRFWNDDYAKRFKKGDLVMAYDKLPRYGGKQIATIRITKNPYRQYLSEMSNEDEKREGGLWGSAMAFVVTMSQYGSKPYVIEFKFIK